MKLSELGVELTYSKEPFTKMPLVVTQSIVNGQATAVRFKDAADYLAQWTGGSPMSAEESEPLPICYYSFQAVTRHYFSPTQPEILEDEDAVEIDFTFDPDAFPELDGNEDEQEEDESDLKNDDIFGYDGNTLGIEELEAEQAEDFGPDASEAMDEAIIARDSIDSEFAQQLAVHGIQPHNLLAALYVYFDDGTRILTGYLAQDTMSDIYDGYLVVLDGCYKAAYDATIERENRTHQGQRVHSQQFAAELLGFISRAGMIPSNDHDETMQLIALNVVTPPVFDKNTWMAPEFIN